MVVSWFDRETVNPGLMDHNHEPPRDGGPREAAQYIARAVAELALMARRHDLGMLGYLLDMAHLEAEQQLKQRADGPL